mmetsp:Transcript_6066/g.19167  ORF Transcript_6066/g.19167 Transcript_6066/m.19167 type:complete len:250 (+) Transcript_6066:303-1052(+)
MAAHKSGRSRWTYVYVRSIDALNCRSTFGHSGLPLGKSADGRPDHCRQRYARKVSSSSLKSTSLGCVILRLTMFSAYWWLSTRSLNTAAYVALPVRRYALDRNPRICNELSPRSSYQLGSLLIVAGFQRPHTVGTPVMVWRIRPLSTMLPVMFLMTPSTSARSSSVSATRSCISGYTWRCPVTSSLLGSPLNHHPGIVGDGYHWCCPSCEKLDSSRAHRPRTPVTVHSERMPAKLVQQFAFASGSPVVA